MVENEFNKVEASQYNEQNVLILSNIIKPICWQQNSIDIDYVDYY